MHVRRERKETVAWVVRLPACDRVRIGTRDLDAHWVPAHEVADLLCVFFVHPRFEFAPPESGTRRCLRGGGGRERGGLRTGDSDGRRALCLLLELAGEVDVAEGITFALAEGGRRGLCLEGAGR